MSCEKGIQVDVTSGNTVILEQAIKALDEEVDYRQERNQLMQVLGVFFVALLAAGAMWLRTQEVQSSVMMFLGVAAAIALLLGVLSRLDFIARYMRTEDDVKSEVLQSWAFGFHRHDIEPWQRAAARQLLIFYLVKRLHLIDGSESLIRGLNRYFYYRGKRVLPVDWSSLSVLAALNALQMTFGKPSEADLDLLWDRGFRIDTFNQAEDCRELLDKAWKEGGYEEKEMEAMLGHLSRMCETPVIRTYAQIGVREA